MDLKNIKIKNTLGMFDMTKGIIMILVILAHTYGLFDGVASNSPFMLVALFLMVLGCAAMPILFVVSGYGFRKMPFKKCLKKQFEILIIPYIVTALITCMVHCISYYILYGGKRVSVMETAKVFIAFAFGFSNHMCEGTFANVACGPIWFLLALVIANLIFNQLLHFFEGKKLLLAALLVSCLGWLLGYVVILPWNINQGMVATLYVALGYYVKKTRLFTSEIPLKYKLLVLVSLFVNIVMICLKMEYDMSSNDYGAGIITIVIEGILSIALIYAFLLMNSLRGRISNLIRSIGRGSLYVLCVHTIEMMGAGKYIQYDFANNWQGSLWLRSLIIFTVRLVLVMGITCAFVRIKTAIYNKQTNKN